MADFCNKCADELFGEGVEPDINVYAIGETLQTGFYLPVLCEGCGMMAISKNEEGLLELAYEDKADQDNPIKFIPIQEWDAKVRSELVGPDQEF